jgi:membrane protein
MMSAGVALYALLSVFPALSALISIYGLFADRSDVRCELESLAGILPAEAVKLLADQMNSLVQTPPARLGIGFVVSLSVALWSAMSGTTGLMQALTVACDATEDRGSLHFLPHRSRTDSRFHRVRRAGAVPDRDDSCGIGWRNPISGEARHR